MRRFRFRARCVEAASNDVYAALEAAAIVAARANNAALWYIGRDLTGVFEDSAGTIPAAAGSPVGLWRDRQYGVGSSSGYPASQATAANKPVIVTLASGHMGAQFDGVNDQLTTALSLGAVASAYTLIAGLTVGVTGADRMVVGDTARRIGVSSGSRAVLQHGGAGAVGSAGTYPAAANLVLAAVSSPETESLYINGAADSVGTLATPTSTPTAVVLGQAGWGGAFTNARVGLVCASPGAMSAPQRAAVERFACHLMGVAYAG